MILVGPAATFIHHSQCP